MRMSDVFEHLRPDSDAPEPGLGGGAPGWPTEALAATELGVDVARTEADLDAVGRLRYELGLVGDDTRRRGADHRRRSLVEPIDRRSLVFFARRKNRALASVRLVRAADAVKDPHLGWLLEAAQPTDLATTVVNSRFAALPERRARAMIVPMFRQMYRSGLIAGARECFIATRSDLVPVFGRFGFRAIADRSSDPGRRQILKLALHDLDHLERINSPLRDIAAEFAGRSGSAARTGGEGR